ncbi:hypothetical protein JRC04_04695 [Mycolicibacterium sp. S2-37]|uniref:hypothetical protein n=1 Tax=Mycolicibacterium sp. S2-37 TaxID=2810297 RepID=UPI001A9449BC|nr:hypothetical protein [Mycolicibacterium sp. S2-37]MBO0676757.1 hypothetical protein [Mycolicibacterium sp. S2-37]
MTHFMEPESIIEQAIAALAEEDLADDAHIRHIMIEAQIQPRPDDLPPEAEEAFEQSRDILRGWIADDVDRMLAALKANGYYIVGSGAKRPKPAPPRMAFTDLGPEHVDYEWIDRRGAVWYYDGEIPTWRCKDGIQSACIWDTVHVEVYGPFTRVENPQHPADL